MFAFPTSRAAKPANRRPRQVHIAAARALSATLALGLLAGCASTPPPSNGTLTSYSGLARVKARRTQASARAESALLMAGRTVRIESVTFAADAQSNATPAQLALIANAMERKLCKELSEKFEIVTAPDKADLTVKTAVTRIKPTDAGAAALSVAVSLVIPAPRLPVGLGGFAAEAEVLGPGGGQAAAMIWSRDADVFGGKRASSIGDAYDLSTKFAHDLSVLLVSGNGWAVPKLTRRSEPESSPCAIYGKDPGFSGAIGGLFGAPPEWTDARRPSF